MEIEFGGVKRRVNIHRHTVRPRRKEMGYCDAKAHKPLNWDNKLVAFCRIDNLALSGNFIAQFIFEAKELENWLTTFLLEDPDTAMSIMLRAQANATKTRAARETTAKGKQRKKSKKAGHA